MRRLSFLPALPILALAALSITGATTPGASATAVFGPPWISIEYPGNPFDRDNRDAFLYVHAFHHSNAIDAGVVGRAEGIVDGRRRTVELQFTKTARPGTYALRRQWPVEGTWMLVISTRGGSPQDYGATALVELGADGAVTSVRVPSAVRDGWTMPTRVTAEQVDAALRARAPRVAGRNPG